MTLATRLIGPLLVPECRVAARRGWVLVLRVVAGIALALPLLMAAWWWWMRSEVEPTFRGDRIVPAGLTATLAISTSLALLLSPSLLAGSLAGERERGSIGLLLSTRVDAREIVLGRLLGKLSVVAAMLAAGWPFIVGFGVLADLSLVSLLAFLVYPLAVAFGAGGLAIAASSVARRGWSALTGIYFAEVILLLAPLLGLIPGAMVWTPPLRTLNPFEAISPAVTAGSAGPALPTIATWTAFGIVGVTFASWRLRPSYLAYVGGKARGSARRRGIPPVGEMRPMLWKELHVERSSALGWFGKVLGFVLIAYLAAGSLGLAGLVAYLKAAQAKPATLDSVTTLAGRLYADTATLFVFLLALAIGLRAAVAVSSERERGTWEALLTSPLRGREILGGKLWGSLHGLRWLFAAVLIAWWVAFLLGVMRGGELATHVAEALVLGLFTAAVGVRASLACDTSTRAMSVTVGVSGASLMALSVLAAVTTLMIFTMFLLSWMIASPLGLVATGTRPWVPTHRFGAIWTSLMCVSYLGLTLSIILESWTRFDEIAGRMAGDGRETARTAPPDGV